MNPIVKAYKDNFIQRFDKDLAIPYYSYQDFPNLKCVEQQFNNSKGIEISYFVYSYDNYNKDKIIIFCPGIGPGHTAYLSEIDYLCQAGYKVVTLDYTGCGASKGDNLMSTNQPTRDVIELINLLNLKEEIVIVGHSLGAYTALNVINLVPSIHKAVIISGFVDISSEMMGFMKLRLLSNFVKRYEKKIDPVYGKINNWKYLKKTTDDLLFIHSTDDPMVNYKYNTGKVIKIKNPHLTVKTVENKKHNPNYSLEALNFMNQSMGGYFQLINEGKLTTLEERKQYFEDKPISKMTEQDDQIMGIILDFIK